MNSKGKIGGKVSVIDIILIIVIIAAVCAVGLKTMGAGGSAQVKTDSQFYVTVKVENVRDYSTKAISEGDIFYEKNASKLGEVTQVSSENYDEIVTLSDGTAKVSSNPEKYTIYITLLCDGKEDSEGYYIGGTRQVAPGMEINIKSNMFIGTATVYEVKTA